MKRTQLYLDDEMHQRLCDLADKQGRTISDLVREAVARAYGPENIDERIATLQGISSLWHDRDDVDANSYVRRLRRDTRRSKNRG